MTIATPPKNIIATAPKRASRPVSHAKRGQHGAAHDSTVSMNSLESGYTSATAHMGTRRRLLPYST
jgi:hypothetical protein